MPALYFGAQALAAPFYPGFSILTNTASQLGSDRSSFPLVLNSGAVLSGLASIVGAYGLFRGLARYRVHRVLCWALALCSVSAGVAALWAGTHPLPDPAHSPGALGAGTFALPLVTLAAAWRLPRGRASRIYLALNLFAFLAVALAMSGSLSVDRQHYAGLLQRAAAATMYLPPAVIACWLLAGGLAAQGEKKQP